MKVSDFAEENFLSLKEDSPSSSSKITSFVPPGYSVIVPTVINPINQRPYPYGFVIRRDGVYRLNSDSVYAYNRTSTEPQIFALTGDEWTTDDQESYKVSTHECLFTPVLPREYLGEREYLPLLVIDAIYTEIIKLGYFPKLYSLIYASDQVTERYKEVMLKDLKDFKEIIPYGIVLLFRMEDPYNLIFILSKDSMSYTTDSIKIKDYALGERETKVLSSTPYIWYEGSVISTNTLPCVVPTILPDKDKNNDFERILKNDIFLLHELHFSISRFKEVPGLIDMLSELSIPLLKELSENLSGVDDILASVLTCEHNKRIDQEISALEKEIEEKRSEYIQKPIK
jgi:hypothetical protein|uniref:Uncharacterized protein n=1 Tax=Myoviridae sp. ctA4D8 TaxID=2823535 RepID=A0A8S5L6L9_9CAUD|nr:MAG TPA: hypothetical protein [Myoviridae sp. ctA4D8]